MSCHPVSVCRQLYQFCNMQQLIEYRKQQGVALTGRNRTGPPYSVGRPTPHAPGTVLIYDRNQP